MTSHPVGRIPRIAAALAAAALSGCDLPFAPGADGYVEALNQRKGVVESVETVPSGTRPGLELRDFTVRSTTGLTVRGRIRVPVSAGPSDRRPLVLLLGGIQRGGDAIELLDQDVPQVGAALSYPEELGPRDAGDAIRRLDNLSSLAWDIPASILLALDHLLSLPEVDPDRVALVGASFGGFFVPAAAGADPRVRDVALLYAGGDLAALIATHLEDDVPPAAAIFGGEMAALRLQRLEPTRYVGDIAPRPVLIVNGLDDDLVVRESAEALIRAARPPKDVVWLPTGHLEPSNVALLEELVDTALARLPVLQEP